MAGPVHMNDDEWVKLLEQLSSTFARKDTKGAEVVLRRVIEAKPCTVKFRLAHGDVLAELDRLDEAETALRAAICIGPDTVEAWRRYGVLLLRRTRAEEAKTGLLSALSLEPNDVASLAGLGRACVALGNWQIAEACLHRAIALNPANGDVYVSLAHVLQGAGRAEDLGLVIHIALILGGKFRLKEYRELAQFLTSAGCFAAAVELLNRYVAQNPEMYEGHMALAVARANLAAQEGRVRPEAAVLPECPAFVPMSMTYQDGRTLLRHTPPFRIFAQLTTMSFAGFIGCNVFAATIKQQFSKGHLTIYHRADRPFKEDILALNPYIDVVLRPREEELLAIDYFEQSYSVYRRPQANPVHRWYSDRRDWVDFMITTPMMSDIRLAGFDHVAKLKVPQSRISELSDRLIALGLDPQRWFCTLHYREPSWRYVLPSWIRDTDPKHFEQVVHRIICDLDGQVVRLGHKGMAPFTPVPGFVDLSQETTMLQAFAVSRSRFMLNGGSGPFMLACAFGVPILAVNAPDIWAGWGKGHYVLLQHLITPNGYRVTPRRALRNELMSTQAITYLVRECGYRVVQNSVDEIVAGARVISDENRAVHGWREPVDERIPTPPNRFVWPPPIGMPWKVLEFPEHVPPGPTID